MATRRAGYRIALNVALDAGLATLAVPLADWIAAPDRTPLGAYASPAWGAVSLLLAGLPFRLSLQYWRFVGPAELLAVAASSVLAAGLFAAGLHEAGIPLPSPSFPVGHALCLLVLLSLPRTAYRLFRETSVSPLEHGLERRPVLLLGAGDGADLFLSALAADPASPWRAVGLLSAGDAQTGRRIQGCPVLGSLADASSALDRLRGGRDAPESLVITDPALDGEMLEPVLSLARREGLAVAWAPRLTALDRSPQGRA